MHHFRGLSHDRPRRIYYWQRPRHGRRITPYLAIDRFRDGDQWTDSRDCLRRIVARELLATEPLYGSRWRETWAKLVPSDRPSHWIKAGYRSKHFKASKTPIVWIPVCFESDRQARSIGPQIAWAIDSLPLPEGLRLETQKRATFAMVALSALGLAMDKV